MVKSMTSQWFQKRWMELSLALGILITGVLWYAFEWRDTFRPNSVTVDEFNLVRQKDAPLFELRDFSGKTYRLEDLRGQVVIVHFWASWCPPCLAELPAWLAAAKRYEGQRIKWVAVSLDENWEAAHTVLPSKGLAENLISLLDLSHDLPQRYGTYQYPETYLLSHDLKVLHKWIGNQAWQSPGVTSHIERALKKLPQAQSRL